MTCKVEGEHMALHAMQRIAIVATAAHHLFAIGKLLFHPPKPEDQRYGKPPNLQCPLQRHSQIEA